MDGAQGHKRPHLAQLPLLNNYSERELSLLTQQRRIFRDFSSIPLLHAPTGFMEKKEGAISPMFKRGPGKALYGTRKTMRHMVTHSSLRAAHTINFPGFLLAAQSDERFS